MKIALIVPASGFSRRFGQNKLLFAYRGKPLIQHALESGLNYPFHQRVLVSQYEGVRELGRTFGYTCFSNADAESGQSASIRIGVEACGGCDAYMFLPGDQPFVSKTTLSRLADAFVSGVYDAACSVYNAEQVTPALLSRAYRAQLLSLSGDMGGKAVLRSARRIFRYEISALEAMDFDFVPDEDHV